MKKILVILAITFFLPGFLLPQQLNLYKEFGDNHTSTSAISFTSDSRYMVVGGYVKTYDLDPSRESELFRTIKKDTEGQADIGYTVSVSPDNRTFLLTKSNQIEIWDMQSRTIRDTHRDGRLAVKTACFSTDGRYIIYMRMNGEIVLLNSSSLEESHRQKLTDEKPTVITPSTDGSKLLIGTASGIMIVFDINNRDITPIRITGKAIYNITMPLTGNYIAASSEDGRIWLGEYPSLKEIGSWQAHDNGYTVISFHPSGRYIASGGKDKAIRIWSVPEGTGIEYKEEAHKTPLTSVAFTPDGSKLASGSENTLSLRSIVDTKVWSFEGAPKIISAAKSDVKLPPAPDVSSKVVKPGSSPQKRLALVIGNGNYQNSVLANPENDAHEMKNILLEYGFDVLEYENLNQTQMKMAMDRFGDRLNNYDVGLFFYAGHGIQSKGYNYLVPIDANIKSEEQVEYDCVQADRILALMESSGSNVNIIILDACRNNPFERSWTRSATGKGLAFMNAPKGSLIAYATAPGSTASDGSGKNGLYTSALLESIKIPDINILQVFQNVRVIVSEKSGGQQIPWESTSLTGDFIF